MESILIKNARVNNLKSVTVELPREKLVVVTGVSGSGKTSLAFDTLYAEGQRRYVESLNSYARQFLARMEKPDVDYIQGLAPAIAIQQQVSTSNPRSTVGTITEVYDFLKLLYARIGRTYSPVSGREVRSDSVSSVVDEILAHPPESRVQILIALPVRSRGYRAELELTLQKGFTRIWRDGAVLPIEDELEQSDLPERSEFYLLIDRSTLQNDDPDELRARLADSIQTAYQEGNGVCMVQIGQEPLQTYSEHFEADGIRFERPSVNFFSFNNPYGACPVCEGFGRVLGIDEKLVIPDPSMSIYEGAVAPWRGEAMNEYQQRWLKAAGKTDFPIHRSYYALTQAEKDMLWKGLPGAEGIAAFFEEVSAQTYKIQYRVMMARYRGYTTCPDCRGTRLRKDAHYVKVGGYSIGDLLFMQLDELAQVVDNLSLSEYDQKVAQRLLHEIRRRLAYLNNVGVGYLSLNRKVNTLSGGEMQRIRLATSLGSGLVGSMYILDEPSIGLHARDTARLVSILESLRDQGNTVIVVEHDELIMRHADRILDIGPGAGALGGEVVFNGAYSDLINQDTLTARYLTGRARIEVPLIRRKTQNQVLLTGAHLHNLKGVDVAFPLHAITVVTGVSGSGKTTLVQEILYPAIRQYLATKETRNANLRELGGALKLISSVEMVDQQPIGRSARSNPVTYIKAYDHIRELFASQPLAQMKDLKPGHFSFNVDGGRCESCKGDGHIVVEMQFLPDVTLPCEACGGKQFKRSVLEVSYKGKNIHEVLNLTIDEALAFFAGDPKIASRIEILQRVGLGYLRMGQSTSTLSGGEAQRMKLAAFLSQSSLHQGALYIFDEPTTGLHFDDIRKLLAALNELVERGNSVLIIEHNLDVIKCADWIVDMGPEGGDQGGQLLFQGSPEEMLQHGKGYTAQYLREKMGAQ